MNASVFSLLVGLWLPIAAWETSREIRAPEDETSYRTYSRELSWKIAPFLIMVGSVDPLEHRQGSEIQGGLANYTALLEDQGRGAAARALAERYPTRTK